MERSMTATSLNAVLVDIPMPMFGDLLKYTQVAGIHTERITQEPPTACLINLLVRLDGVLEIWSVSWVFVVLVMHFCVLCYLN